VNYFRTGGDGLGDLVDRLLDERRAVLCGVVEMELLHGLRTRETSMVARLFQALRYEETRRNDFAMAGHILSRLTRRGITIPATDALVAALCIRNGLSLLSTDHHFDHIDGLARVPLP